MFSFIPGHRFSLHYFVRLTPFRNRPPAHHPALFNRSQFKFMGTLPDGDWKTVKKPNAVAYQLFTRPIVKSEQDDRDYRIIQLDNGLQITLVHDAKADKAAASLDVAVGHLYDAVSISNLSFETLF